MSLLHILHHPDPRLRTKAKAITEFPPEVATFAADMLETMYVAPGIGLAAIQIGVPKRVIVIDLSKGDEKKPFYFVNPRIIKKSENNSTYEEGCLSVPGQFAEVDRPDQCHISYLDYNGQKKELKAEGLLATCIQHEMDHLEGILFIDYLSKLKKNFIVKKLSKQKKVLERIVV